MKVSVIGAGPGGLYFAIQLKKARPDCQIDIYERNARGSTFGWGVVFSDETLRGFLGADRETFQQISDALYHWDDIDVHFRGHVLSSSGHGFSGISRQALLDILAARAESLGVSLHFEAQIEQPLVTLDADLIVAADGIFSKTRDAYSERFEPDIDWRRCRYVWLGTDKLFDAFTFIFEETEFGWFQAHCYRFAEDTSTFIVECPEEVWRAAGLEAASTEEGIEFCEKLFAKYLDGHRLRSNAAHLRGSSVWISFPRVNCAKWHHDKLVLLGDAAASAHFSIGSGTKLAMESAIALAEVVAEEQDIQAGLDRYQEQRRIEVLRLQSAARNSTEWFENVRMRAHLDPMQFAYSLLTRSQRVSHENLRLRDKEYLEGVECWFASKETGREVLEPMPPMFVPMQLRGVTLRNRIAVSPMATYSAKEGMPNDFHLVHLGQRALGGAGLVFTEMTCVSPEARITPGCVGLYSDEQCDAWGRIVRFVREYTDAKICLQIGHAGRKGSTRVAWEGMDLPLEDGNWPVYAPSALAYTPDNQLPIEMARADMDRVRDDFIRAAEYALRADFDMLELHCAHGYLLSTFISPLCNKRSDEYGGSLENRLRYPLEVFAAVRAAWPEDRPISVRISACDWVEGGTDVEDAVYIAAMFKERGLDVIDVSTGQVSPDQKPVYGRMYQTPFADRIRAEVGLRTMTVGNIYEPDHVNSILAAGRADLCLLARPHLADPHWTLRAGAELGYGAVQWPVQYESGKAQLYRIFERAKEMQELV